MDRGCRRMVPALDGVRAVLCLRGADPAVGTPLASRRRGGRGKRASNPRNPRRFDSMEARAGSPDEVRRLNKGQKLGYGYWNSDPAKYRSLVRQLQGRLRIFCK